MDLFNDLESNIQELVEEAKKKILENVNSVSAKESWFVHGMMDYFAHTNSTRIVDVLVKIQQPFEKYIFDRSVEWLRGPNRIQAVNLFGHIIKRHPTWLYKVAGHQLMKDILKLLKTDNNIIFIMSSLYCIIMLLPIIPSPMTQYLSELFDVFFHLASWNCSDETKFTDDQLIHLQIGLSTLFHRLYGLYPCNFIGYLREHLNKEKKCFDVFTHTIKPLLDTVKIHPMLLMSSKESETDAARWKEMEPHDVVVECSKFSLDYMGKIQETSDCPQYLSAYECPYVHRTTETPITIPVQLKKLLNAGPFVTGCNSPHFKENRDVQNFDKIWTPSVAILATPPPIGTVPHTPTPSLSLGVQFGGSGASPPEAAVEATPETTPLKDHIRTARTFPVGLSAARTILHSNSQPSSPLKKESSPFRFPDPTISSQFVCYDQQYQATSVATSRLMKLLNDRDMSHAKLINDKLNQLHPQNLFAETNPTNISSVEFCHIESPLNSNMNFDSTREDLEVREINKNIEMMPSKSLDKVMECDDNYQLEESLSPCSAGGLHILNPMSMYKFAQRLKTRNKHDEYICSSISDRNTLNANTLPRISVETQTLEHNSNVYEQFFFKLFSDKIKTQVTNPQISPHMLLDQYIEVSLKRNQSSDQRNHDDIYREHIQLVSLQLQYERHHREMHAERNRRLLGKSRVNAALEMDNKRLKDQVNRLSDEVQKFKLELNKAKIFHTQQEKLKIEASSKLRKEIQIESDEKKQLKLMNENMQRTLNEEIKFKRDLTVELEAVRAELFDLKNELQQAQYQADLGLHYKEELNRLQSEVVIMGELQIKCRDKIADINNLKARDAELELHQIPYDEEMKELRSTLDIKTSQFETAKIRLTELEGQLTKRDSMFADQKRLLKSVKEEYEEKFKALEKKYTTQKSINLRLEDEILELYKNNSTIILPTLSPESEKTADIVGSLDHTSPLSMSLASSEELSMSLRSVTEIKNLQALVVQPDATSNNINNNSNTNNNSNINIHSNNPQHTITSMPLHTTSSSIITTSTVTISTNSNNIVGGVASSNRQAVSNDIPVPTPGTSQHHHLHHLQK